MFAGHIKVLGGPIVARGPDVAHTVIFDHNFAIKI